MGDLGCLTPAFVAMDPHNHGVPLPRGPRPLIPAPVLFAQPESPMFCWENSDAFRSLQGCSACFNCSLLPQAVQDIPLCSALDNLTSFPKANSDGIQGVQSLSQDVGECRRPSPGAKAGLVWPSIQAAMGNLFLSAFRCLQYSCLLNTWPEERHRLVVWLFLLTTEEQQKHKS